MRSNLVSAPQATQRPPCAQPCRGHPPGGLAPDTPTHPNDPPPATIPPCPPPAPSHPPEEPEHGPNSPNNGNDESTTRTGGHVADASNGSHHATAAHGS